MAENDAPEKGITIQQALEMATESERDILSILVRGGPIKTNRGMLKAARLINKHFRLDTRADLAAADAAQRVQQATQEIMDHFLMVEIDELPDSRQIRAILTKHFAATPDAVRQARRCEVCDLLESSLSHNAGTCNCAQNGQCYCRFAALRAEGEKGE